MFSCHQICEREFGTYIIINHSSKDVEKETRFNKCSKIQIKRTPLNSHLDNIHNHSMCLRLEIHRQRSKSGKQFICVSTHNTQWIQDDIKFDDSENRL